MSVMKMIRWCYPHWTEQSNTLIRFRPPTALAMRFAAASANGLQGSIQGNVWGSLEKLVHPTQSKEI